MQSKQTAEMNFRALGTDIQIQIVCRKENQSAVGDIEKVERIYRKFHERFNRFSPDSELSFFNSHLGSSHEASDSFVEICQYSLDFFLRTGGLFDPRVIEVLERSGYAQDFLQTDFSKIKIDLMRPERYVAPLSHDLIVNGNKVTFLQRMDFSGTVKGYITDVVSDCLIKWGWKDFFVNSGGDLVGRGKNTDGDPWHIALEGIDERQLLIDIRDEAIATSGISRRKWEAGGKRFHHLIDPKRPGYYDFSLRSVTVVEPSCMVADVWAKTLFLMGKEAGMAYANQHKMECIFLDYSGRAFVSQTARNMIQKENLAAGTTTT